MSAPRWLILLFARVEYAGIYRTWRAWPLKVPALAARVPPGPPKPPTPPNWPKRVRVK